MVHTLSRLIRPCAAPLCSATTENPKMQRSPALAIVLPISVGPDLLACRHLYSARPTAHKPSSILAILIDHQQHGHSTAGLVRSFGLLQAAALNMSNMVGVGPFITIPLIIAAMGGPQCMLGWLLGAVLALCDGLVWSELAAALPGSGGTYLYLREAFRRTRLGNILPFLFIWQFIVSGPLEIASGDIGFAQYVGYFWRGMGPAETRLVSLALGTRVTVLLYRRIN